MKVWLMHRDRDFDPQQPLPWNEAALTQDLELTTLLEAMAVGDKFVFDVAKTAVLCGLSNDRDTILYRQSVLRDCMNNAAVIRRVYDIAADAIAKEHKSFFRVYSRYSSSILHGAIEVMEMFVDALKQLRKIAVQNARQFDSEGFTRFFAMLERELGDDYFAQIEEHLKTLQFRDGVLISARLGKGVKGVDYVLCKPQVKKRSWTARIFGDKTPTYSYSLHPRDESGAKALAELKERGIHLVAGSLAQSTEHILSFLILLRTELAFYVGCLNLSARLTQLGQPIAFGAPLAIGERRHSYRGLYDVCLALRMEQAVIGNDLDADNHALVIITGANRGGKSTYLRSIGLSQLMMQSGMFVAAESFSCNLCDRLVSHYKREEDTTMRSGKLDEELSRMSDIVEHLTPNAMLLLNESFGATNEREGSEIAGQIIRALLEHGAKIFFVTHLHPLARGFYDRQRDTALFLRAERETDGSRPFKLVQGKPLQTSYGEDLYRQVFDANDGALAGKDSTQSSDNA
jgi:DNA mismatch repair ATPase MutS